MDLEERLAIQDGVISRPQALASGLRPHDIRRRLRRNEWASVHPGVYVDHTGPLTWQQRAWAAVLWARPGAKPQGAALCGESALRAADGPGRRGHHDGDPIHVAVDRQRGHLVVPDGVRLHHASHLAGQVLWNTSPPRQRYEEAALDLACGANTEMAAIAALANACQSRRTTATRLVDSLDARKRVPRRDWLRGILRDVAQGTCSVLEHGYLVRVERPHGLPPAARQEPATASTGVVYRDASYGEFFVELDGRLFHDTAGKRDEDFERDLDAAAEGRRTIRLSYGQVFGRPCSTAAKVAQVLANHGIEAGVHGCGPGCPVAREQAA